MHCFGTGKQAIGSLVVILVLALGGCGTSESSEPAIAAPGGPCLDELDRVVGNAGIEVIGGTQSIEASLGSMTINHCPGQRNANGGPLEGDGFFFSLEHTAVDVQPGGQITLSAPGYLAPWLTGAWSIGGSTTSRLAVDLTVTDDTTWQLTAPESIGVHRLDLRLDWAEGMATYAVLITTDGSATARTTTSGLPVAGLSTDEGVPGDALPPDVIFDSGEYEETGLMDGTALLGTVRGVEALVFVCRGVQITASDPSSPGLARLMEDIAEQVLDRQDCVPELP